MAVALQRTRADEAAQLRGELAHCRSLLAEFRGVLSGVIRAVAILEVVRRSARWSAELAARAPLDVAAERAVLAAAGRANALDERLRPDDFGEPLHRALARAVRTGIISDELAQPEVIGYVRGLLRDHVGAPGAATSVVRVAALARQRRALLVAEAAVGALRWPDCEPHATAAELRGAANILESASRGGP